MRQVIYHIVSWWVFGLTLTLVLPVKAQTPKDLLHSYFTEVRSGQYPPIHKHITLQENAKSTLSAIQPYLNDTAVVVRAKAYAVVQIAGNNSRKSSEREDAVKKLIEGIKDTNSGNALALCHRVKSRSVSTPATVFAPCPGKGRRFL